MEDTLQDLLAGIYLHYKGHHYLVLGYGHDANADSLFEQVGERDFRRLDTTEDGEDRQRNVVVYIGLELQDSKAGTRLSIRSVDDFFLLVCWNPDCDRYGTGGERPNSGACSLCTQSHRPRFSYLGPTYEPAATT